MHLSVRLLVLRRQLYRADLFRKFALAKINLAGVALANLFSDIKIILRPPKDGLEGHLMLKLVQIVLASKLEKCRRQVLTRIGCRGYPPFVDLYLHTNQRQCRVSLRRSLARQLYCKGLVICRYEDDAFSERSESPLAKLARNGDERTLLTAYHACNLQSSCQVDKGVGTRANYDIVLHSKKVTRQVLVRIDATFRLFSFHVLR